MAFPGLSFLMRGGASMVRTLTVNTPAWTALEFRSAEWFGAATMLSNADQAAAQARGQVRYIQITVGSGTVQLAEVEVPGDQFSAAAAAGTFASTNRGYTNTAGPAAGGVHTMYYRTIGGAATFEVYVEFDIPPAP